MRKNKHLSPELQEQYRHFGAEYLHMTNKKRNILFVLWFVILIGIGIVNFVVLPGNLVISLLFLLWSLTGLTVTLIDRNKRMTYIESHVFADQLDEAAKANGEK